MKSTRREFLKDAALVTGASAAGAVLAAGAVQAADARPKWKCGVGLNGFMSSAGQYQKNYPIWEVMDFAAREGFDGIELVEGWPMGGYPSPDEPARVAALKRMYDQYGLRTYTFQTGSSAPYSADPDVRKKWLETFAQYVRLAKQLGCDFIGQWPGGGLEGQPDVDHAITALAGSYREAAKMCADAGIHMSFEIEPPFIFNTLDHLRRILEETDHPACRTNYDPSHFDLMTGSRGKPEEMLAELGVKHIGHVHLTDTDGTLFGGTSKHLSCGDGHCDIPASLKTLWDGGYPGWIMIDGWLIEDVYDAAHKGIQAIKSSEERFRANT